MNQTTVHLTQLAGALLMSGLLWLFLRQYGRPYLRLWALSFLALALHVGGMVLATYARAHWDWRPIDPGQLAVTWFYTSAGALQILALLAGIYALTSSARHWVRARWLLLGAGLIGAALTLPWATDPEVNLQRLFLRVGTRYLLGGLALALAAFWVLRNGHRRHVGQQLTGWVLVLYAAELLLQAVVAVPLLWGQMVPAHIAITPVHGLIELVVYPMLGVGLVIWLLSNEDQRRSEAEARLQAAGRTDPVTGLANESGLVEELGQLGSATSVLGLLGLDQFKLVNESQGMHGGDALLRRVAEHLRRHVPDARALGRLGGDEFLIVMPPTLAAANSLESARAALGRGSGGSQPGLLRASLGWTRIEGVADLRSALARAGAALRYAKQEGGGKSLEFRAEMADAKRDWVLLEEELENAFARDAFVLYLQPLVAGGRNEVIAYEALLRWHHPQRGVLAPDQFLPSLRTLRQMQRVDAMVIEQAARLLADAPKPAVPIAVNLGADTLLAAGTVDLIASVLKRHGVSPGLLHLEITEETALRSLEQGSEVLQQLRALGVDVALDDFGSGFSSLTHLSRLPIRRIKFDRHFLAAAINDYPARAVLAALVPLARQLGLRSVAEGVESRAQLELAESLGFDELQGYHFGRPEPASMVLARRAAARQLRVVGSPREGG
jgi:diguanylate cyclase (GGDEF)-like protein